MVSRDDLHTLLVALSPGALGFAIAVAGLLLTLPRLRHRRVWFASLTFILLQAAIVVFVSLTFGGGITLNRFTITSGTGLLVYIATLVAYSFKAFGNERKQPPI
jgi:hypothetical protein